MAKFTGNVTTLVHDSNTLIGAESASITYAVGVLDTTTMGAGVATREFISDGLLTFSATVNFKVDGTETHYPTPGDVATMVVNDGNESFSGSYICMDFGHEINIGTEVKRAYNFQGTGVFSIT